MSCTIITESPELTARPTQKANFMTGRSSYIDQWRGISVLAVIANHFIINRCAVWLAAPHSHLAHALTWRVAAWGANEGMIGLDIFFVMQWRSVRPESPVQDSIRAAAAASDYGARCRIACSAFVWRDALDRVPCDRHPVPAAAHRCMRACLVQPLFVACDRCVAALLVPCPSSSGCSRCWQFRSPGSPTDGSNSRSSRLDKDGQRPSSNPGFHSNGPCGRPRIQGLPPPALRS
jgi:hypothetical protein